MHRMSGISVALRTFSTADLKVAGLLEDYAHLIAGLLALYATTFAPRWYAAAEAPRSRSRDVLRLAGVICFRATVLVWSS